MKMIFKNCKIVCEDGVLNGKMVVNGNSIESINNKESDNNIDKDVYDLDGKYIIPGFFDTHLHGLGLCDCVLGRADSDSLKFSNKYDNVISNIMESLPKTGITSAFLSTFAAPENSMQRFLEEGNSYINSSASGGAKLMGLDIEGSFVKDPLFAGAQDPINFFKPSIELFNKMQKWAGGNIKKVLVAPEWGESAYKLIKYLSENSVCATVGHTGCTKEELLHAYDCGTRVVVHCGNGPMSQNFKTGGALDGIFELGSKMYGELICDFKHNHPHWLNTFINSFSLAHSLGISDSNYLTCAGLEEGREVGEWVIRDGALWVKNKKNTLAGSVTPLNRSFNNMLNLFTGDRKAYFQKDKEQCLSINDALVSLSRMFSLNGAQLYNLDNKIGSLKAGKSADFIVADISGNAGNYKFDIEKVFVSGREIRS